MIFLPGKWENRSCAKRKSFGSKCESPCGTFFRFPIPKSPKQKQWLMHSSEVYRDGLYFAYVCGIYPWCLFGYVRPSDSDCWYEPRLVFVCLISIILDQNETLLLRNNYDFFARKLGFRAGIVWSRWHSSPLLSSRSVGRSIDIGFFGMQTAWGIVFLETSLPASVAQAWHPASWRTKHRGSKLSVSWEWGILAARVGIFQSRTRAPRSTTHTQPPACPSPCPKMYRWSPFSVVR